EVELGEVADVPVRLGVIFPGHLDQMRVQVHPGDVVSGAGQVPAQTPAAASGIEDAGTARGHRVDQPGLTVDVLPGGLDAAPALCVPAGVLRIAAHGGDPHVLLGPFR